MEYLALNAPLALVHEGALYERHMPYPRREELAAIYGLLIALRVHGL